jgi:hypothetical protein
MRAYISLMIAGVTAIMVTSGFLSFFTPFSSTTARVHAFFGLLLTIIAIFHIYHNRKALFNYLGYKSNSKNLYPRLLAFLSILLLAFLAWKGLFPINLWLSSSYEERKKEESLELILKQFMNK